MAQNTAARLLTFLGRSLCKLFGMSQKVKLKFIPGTAGLQKNMEIKSITLVVEGSRLGKAFQSRVNTSEDPNALSFFNHLQC